MNHIQLHRIPAHLLLAGAAAMVNSGYVLAADTDHGGRKDKILYIWAGDQAHKAPDFLTVVNFDENSDQYGQVIKTVPIPPPGNIGNEPHHCHLNASRVLGINGT